MGWSKNKESERPFFKRDMWYGFIKGDNIFEKVLNSKSRLGPRVSSSG